MKTVRMFQTLTTVGVLSLLQSCATMSDFFSYDESSTKRAVPMHEYQYRYDDPKKDPQANAQDPQYGSSNPSTAGSHQERDVSWINTQAPDNYTIQIAKDENPAVVAKTIFVTPKMQRTAQYRYQQNNKTYYGGVYGSFKSREEAEHALANLPPDVRGSARITTWQDVQSNAVTSTSKNTISRPKTNSNSNATTFTPTQTNESLDLPAVGN
jgi:hypothetical protein